MFFPLTVYSIAYISVIVKYFLLKKGKNRLLVL